MEVDLLSTAYPPFSSHANLSQIYKSFRSPAAVRLDATRVVYLYRMSFVDLGWAQVFTFNMSAPARVLARPQAPLLITTATVDLGSSSQISGALVDLTPNMAICLPFPPFTCGFQRVAFGYSTSDDRLAVGFFYVGAGSNPLMSNAFSLLSPLVPYPTEHNLFSSASVFNLVTVPVMMVALSPTRIVAVYVFQTGPVTPQGIALVPLAITDSSMSLAGPRLIMDNEGHSMDFPQPFAAAGGTRIVLQASTIGSPEEDRRCILVFALGSWPTLLPLTGLQFLSFFKGSTSTVSHLDPSGKALYVSESENRGSATLFVRVFTIPLNVTTGLVLRNATGAIDVNAVGSPYFESVLDTTATPIRWYLALQTQISATVELFVVEVGPQQNDTLVSPMAVRLRTVLVAGDTDVVRLTVLNGSAQIVAFAYPLKIGLLESLGLVSVLQLPANGSIVSAPSDAALLRSPSGQLGNFTYQPAIASPVRGASQRWCLEGPVNATVDMTTGAVSWSPTDEDTIESFALVGRFPIETQSFQVAVGALPKANPVAPTVGPFSSSAITLQWTPAPPIVSLAVLQYQIQITEAVDADFSSAGAATTTLAAVATPGWLYSFEAAGLSAATPYRFRVRALNLQGPAPWSPEGEQSTRVLCPDGEFRPAESPVFGPCQVCLAGTYAAGNADSCTACPAASTSPPRSVSAAACACIAGTYAVQNTNASALRCDPCPSGGVCPGGSVIPLPSAGFFDVSPNQDGSRFVACPRAAACAGFSRPGCARGHRGFVCSTCAGDYYATENGACARCPDTSIALFALLLALALALVALFLWVSVLRPAGETSMDLNRKSKVPYSLLVAIVFLQTLSSISSMDVGWPASARQALNYGAVFALDLRLFATGCTIRSVYSLYALGLLGPFALMLLAVVGFHAAKLFLPATRLQVSSTLGLIERLAHVVGPMAYIPLAKLTLVIFDCVSLPNGRYYIDSARGNLCFDAQWGAMMLLGIPGLALYVLGLPALFAWRLWRVRNSLFETGTIARYGALYGKFRAAAFYVELALFAKKLVLVLAIVFLNQVALFQALLLAGLFSAASLLVVAWQPYYVNVYNALETRLNVAVTLVLLLGSTFLGDNFGSAPAKLAFTVATIAVVVVASVVLALAMIAEIRGLYRSSAHAFEREAALLRLAEAEAPHLSAEMQSLVAVLRRAVAEGEVKA